MILHILKKHFSIFCVSLRFTYQGELESFDFGKIPDGKLIANYFAKIIKILQK
ncbi:hypothetical protein EZS27_021599 [termite gut metagenome]|uniref:Uncharacterized protein n=1 Tax=termite gut metagenome TaxID=433724 RepID=A0A5J4RA75_9ZZZZ